MTLEDLELAKNLTATRELLLEKLKTSEEHGPGAFRIFGVPLDDGLKGAIRATLRAALRDRLIVCESALQDLGIIIPDAVEPRAPGWDPLAGVAADPAPKVEQAAPGHASIAPSSWDADTREFTIRVPCAPARALRYNLSDWREVDESLNPHGLDTHITAPVYDVTNVSRTTMGRTACGIVVGVQKDVEGVDLKVRLDGYHGLLQADVAAGRIVDVQLGYAILEENTFLTETRPLVNVHRWLLKEIRLVRHTDLSAAA